VLLLTLLSGIMISEVFGSSMRNIGHALENLGVRLQGRNAYVDRCTCCGVRCVVEGCQC